MLSVHHLSKTYKKHSARPAEAVKDVSLEVADGEMLAIVGRSGAGKTTLLSLIAGLDIPDEGTMEWDGKPINIRSASAMARFRNENIGFVVQNYGLLDDLTAWENTALPLKYNRQRSTESKKRRALRLLRTVGMEEIAEKYPPELSGGECQRVAIARALICQPKLLLADEPTGSLDTENEARVIEIFKRLNAEGITIIIVTHNEVIAKACHRVVIMEDGRILP